MITNSNLAALQKAGGALHEAKQAMTEALTESSQTLVASIAENPFGAESDRSVTNLRAVAHMANDLRDMEEKLVAMYQSAKQLMTAKSPLLIALSQPDRPAPAKRGPKPKVTATESAVSDVQVIQSRSLTKEGKKKAKPKKKSPANGIPVRVTANDKNIESYFQSALNKKTWTPVTHADIHTSAGIPMGSVGATLARVKARGLVQENAKGEFRLA